jgi:hypothetical protein
MLGVLFVAVLAACLVATLYAIAGGHPPSMAPRAVARRRKGERLFVPSALTRRLPEAAGPYNRPPDVALNNQGIPAPPREIEGVNGE